MKNKKTNRSKVFTMLILLVTLIVTMGVMVGCDKKENTPDSENDTTEVVEVTEDLEEPESEEVEDPVEVEEPEIEEVETEDPEVVNPETEEVNETDRVQPEVFYSTFTEFTDFVDSLELEELVVLYYNEESEKNIIIYNTDEFIMEDEFIMFNIHSEKEISEVITSIEVQEYVIGLYVYAFSVDPNVEQDLTITITYADGTEEEFNMHLIPE
ncbi:MAG: hypothetical protein IJZ00_01860 [Lachnospiraceae bacterium]|nr:hypothetical protein [Lachnospiraceae bacterium]